MDVTQVARICHETNRAYCESIGDNTQKPWNEADVWQKESAINGVEFHLNNLREGREANPAASHENWMAEKKAAGWKWGPVKDVETKEHPCFLPYNRLPAEQKMKDYLFTGIVTAFYAAANTPVAQAA